MTVEQLEGIKQYEHYWTWTGVVEAKHHHPFNGAFWQWNYWLVTIVGTRNDQYDPPWEIGVPGITTIFFATQYDWHKQPTPDVFRRWLMEKPNRYQEYDIAGFDHFSTVSFYPIDDELWEKVAYNFIPKFVEVVPGFRWKCARCGEMFEDLPANCTIREAGGIMFEADNYYCEDCADESAEEEAEAWRKDILHTLKQWTADMAAVNDLGEVRAWIDGAFEGREPDPEEPKLMEAVARYIQHGRDAAIDDEELRAATMKGLEEGK